MGVRGTFLGLVTTALLVACGGAQPDDVVMSPSSAKTATPVDHNEPVPQATVRQLTGCAERSAERSVDGRSSNALHYDVKLGDRGQVLGLEFRGMTSADAALETCVREAIAAMIVPERMLRPRSSRPLSGGERMTRDHRGLLGSSDSENPLVSVGEIVVEMVGLEVIIEVGFGVIAAIGTIVVPNTKNPRDKCTDHYVACMDTNFGNVKKERGSLNGRTRCEWCKEICEKKNGGIWPIEVDATVGKRSCQYPGWERL